VKNSDPPERPGQRAASMGLNVVEVESGGVSPEVLEDLARASLSLEGREPAEIIAWAAER